jgi:hypothetical protein
MRSVHPASHTEQYTNAFALHAIIHSQLTAPMAPKHPAPYLSARSARILAAGGSVDRSVSSSPS